MNRAKAQILDHHVSAKVLAGPSASPASAAARAALAADPVYRELRRRLDAAGVFAPAPAGYAWRIAVNLALSAAGWAAIVGGCALWLRGLGAVVVGMAMVQSSFLAHDAGHGAITRRGWAVELLGQLHATLIAGFAFGYFRRSHDLHHFHTNEETLDPDCLSDAFSVHDRAALHKTGPGRAISRHQAIVMPLVFPLWALTMKWDGLTYVVRHRARREFGVLGLHAVLWLVVPAAIVGPAAAIASYLAANAVAGIYLGLVIPVNHIGMTYLPADHARSFLEHQLATCRNVRSPAVPVLGPLFDFLFIGMNRQIEHHLFPWAPVGRLAAAAAITRALCREHGLPYHEQPYRDAARAVLRQLARVAALVPPAALDVTDPSPDRALPEPPRV